MPIDVVMPKLGLTMTEGLLAKWLAPDGARVEKDQPILAIETAKAVVESPSPASGILRHAAQAGATVPVMGVIGRILEADEAATAAPAALPREPAAPPAAMPPVPPVEPAPTRREGGDRVRPALAEVAGTVTIATDADASALMAAQARLSERRTDGARPSPSYNDLFAKLVARCLREFPGVHVRIEGDLTPLGAAGNAGLVAQGERAAEGTSALASAFLWVGRVADEPVSVGGIVAVRPVMSLSFAYDAGQLDRATAARLLWRLRQLIEDPLLAL